MVVFAAAATLGCTGADYNVAPVSGTISFDGRPLSGGQLMFAPVASGGGDKAGKAGFAKVQPDGSFVVSTYGDGDGAVVAKHRVTLINNPKSEAGKRLGVNRVIIPEAIVVNANEENRLAIEITPEMLKRFSVTF
ncbi:MAG: hypothetical protein AAGG46_00500 [Planctomycetota bacterium]